MQCSGKLKILYVFYFFYNSCGRLFPVRRFHNGTPHHNMGGTVGKGLSRCGYAALVVQGAACRPHAGRYDQEVRPAGFTDFLCFLDLHGPV